jgi:hypothetical protein
MTPMRAKPIAVLIALLAGCAQPPASPEEATRAVHAEAALDEPFRLAIGETARLNGGALLVTFRSVAADSRCPLDAVCVWEGDAAIRVEVVVPGAAATAHELHTTLQPRAVEVGGYRVELLELQPYPRASERTPPGAYVARLRATRSAGGG